MFYGEEKSAGGTDGDLLGAEAGDVLEQEDEDEAVGDGIEKEEEPWE